MMTKTPNLSIQAASPDILNALAGRFPSRNFQDLARYLQQALREECLFFVGVKTLIPIGYCLVYWQSKFPRFREEQIPEIVDLLVVEELRRQGYGSALLEYIEHYLCYNNHKRVGLSVSISNIQARSLYEGRGYITLNLHPDDPSTLIMVKNLLS